MALRRAYADEYAVRVNRAAVLVRELVPADAVRALQAEFDLSERQARRYVNVALRAAGGCAGAGAHGGVHGPAGAVADRRPARACGRDRSDVERGDCRGGARLSRSALASGAVARRVEIEFVGDRLAGARLAQAYSVLAPERRRVTEQRRER